MAQDRAEHSIRVRKDTWHALHSEKEPGDTFDDVLRRVLAEAGHFDESESQAAPA